MSAKLFTPYFLFFFRKKKSPYCNIFSTTQTEDDSEKPKATRHLILIRHGQYNLKGKTDPERYLSDLGREQAVLTGHYFSEHGIFIKFLTNRNMF